MSIDPTTLESCDKVVATFSPKRTDDLRAGVSAHIGWRGEWLASWIIEDGPYEGQWAMSVAEPRNAPLIGWVPWEDLSHVAPQGEPVPAPET